MNEEAPDAVGKTWASVIAETLLNEARKGDIRAAAEIANRTEGRPAQSLALGFEDGLTLAERMEMAEKRLRLRNMSEGELESEIKRLQGEIGMHSPEPGKACSECRQSFQNSAAELKK